MNKKISKIVLFTTVGVMLATSLSIGLNNRENYEVKDISGNRDVLNNVNIVYQQNKGIYQTTEVIVSKDKVEVDNYAKGVFYNGNSLDSGFSLSKLDKEHREILRNADNKYQIYKDDDSVGNVNTQISYNNNNEGYLTAYIDDKNLKTNKINSYEIPLDYKFSNESSIDDTSASLVYDGELYVLVGINKDSDYTFGEEAKVYASKESLVNIYKLDLENEKSELVASRSIGKKEDLVNIGNMFFTYKNSFYFIKESYKKIGDNKFKKELTLMSYNLDNKKFDSLKLPIIPNKHDNISNFYVEDGKVSFLVYQDSKKSEISLSITTMNLKDNTFINQNENYDLKFDDDKFNYGVEELRSIDDKLYITISAYVPGGDLTLQRDVNAKYLYVIDEKSKEDLYIGKLKQESNSYTNLSILTDEEL